ncbi:MAG: endo-1,4-beta-xylanase, partial [Lachnospiraceae bacterium]|nr:endo-1,4-beta-xylanase [Lachnospiraceae bacterium]
MKRFISNVLSFAMLVSLLLVPATESRAASDTLLNTYGSAFGYTGTCINLHQLQNANTLAHVKSQYNSITLENEMKPDAMLGYSATLISRDSAKSMGYYIPSGMNESNVPRINFSTVDEVMKICYENGLSMRAHTLVWHSQTPDWFFRTGYSSNGSYVSRYEMDLRMEYYVKSVINHVYASPYGRVVYAWDVVNEYMHATNCGWLSIYGGVNTNPDFVKKAFQYSDEALNQLGLGDSVKLFYNDYNTYMEADKIVTMVKYINSEKKLCDGIGMQSHLATDFPSVSYYTDALKKFLNTGCEVQITELDIKNKGDSDQAKYTYDLMSSILAVKKSGGKITGMTIWGLSDDVTWIRGEKPLFFSTMGNPKEAYYSMLDAYQDAGLSSGGNNNGNNNWPGNS